MRDNLLPIIFFLFMVVNIYHDRLKRKRRRAERRQEEQNELPPELHDTACSVYSVTGRSTPQEAVIRAIVDELDSAYAHWIVNPHWALDDYRAACASLGHRVRRGSICGEAVSIADDFALLICTDAGELVPVSSGEILYA